MFRIGESLPLGMNGGDKVTGRMAKKDVSLPLSATRTGKKSSLQRGICCMNMQERVCGECLVCIFIRF